MTRASEITAFLRFIPQIYFACHRRHVRAEKGRKALSLNQARILDHLDGFEPTNLRLLAKHMGVTASTMSLNVDRLEHAGYVDRERDRRDSRRVEIRLTKGGSRLKRQQSVLDSKLVAVLLKRLNAPDRANALHGLELLATAATEMIEGWQSSARSKKSPGGRIKRSPL